MPWYDLPGSRPFAFLAKGAFRATSHGTQIVIVANADKYEIRAFGGLRRRSGGPALVFPQPLFRFAAVRLYTVTV